jgi:hypothetical protein
MVSVPSDSFWPDLIDLKENPKRKKRASAVTAWVEGKVMSKNSITPRVPCNLTLYGPDLLDWSDDRSFLANPAIAPVTQRALASLVGAAVLTELVGNTTEGR